MLSRHPLQSKVKLRRGHLVAVLFANPILWTAAVLVTGNSKLGGPGVIAMVSIGSLWRARS